MSPRGASVAHAAVHGPGCQGSAARSGGRYASTMSSASAVASTSSTARATMLRYGFVADLVRESRAGQRRAARSDGAGRRPGSPATPGPADRARPAWSRAWSAFDQGTCRSPNSDRQSAGARSSPSVDTIRPSFIGYSVRMPEGHEPGVAGEVGWLEGRDQVDRLEGDLERLVERRADALRSRAAERREKPPTRTDTGWIARPPMSSTIRLPVLLRRSPDSTAGRWCCGQVERARVAEEVGQVEQVDVEGVALDPLAAVEQPSQCPDRRVDLDAEGVLERVDRGHLVGDRADPADPGHDVDDLVGRPADDEPLEVARRLEDLEVGLLDDPVPDPEPQRALALDPGQSRDVDRRGRRSSSGGASCHASVVSGAALRRVPAVRRGRR